MIKMLLASVIFLLPLLLSGCDPEPYDAAAHQRANAASTGSSLSGVDTGADLNGHGSDPSLRTNFGSKPGT